MAELVDLDRRPAKRSRLAFQDSAATTEKVDDCCDCRARRRRTGSVCSVTSTYSPQISGISSDLVGRPVTAFLVANTGHDELVKEADPIKAESIAVSCNSYVNGASRGGSPPRREDDSDGHYMFELGESLTSRYKILRKMGEDRFFQGPLKGLDPGDATGLRTCTFVWLNQLKVRTKCKNYSERHELAAVEWKGLVPVLKWRPAGTFGRVLECWDREAHEYIAIKVIRNVQKYRDAAMIEIDVLRVLAKHDRTGSWSVTCFLTLGGCCKHSFIIDGIKFKLTIVIGFLVGSPSFSNAPICFVVLETSGCVRMKHWFDYRNHICIVFELLGPSLYDFLRKNRYRPFPTGFVREFGHQLLKSIAYMHDLTLIHTDLKPENVLLVSSDYIRVPDSKAPTKYLKHLPKSSEIKLIDFGSATFESQHHCSVVSTRHYRAPEVILGLGWSYPCDLWSVGCILVELCVGEVLFQTHENLEHLAMMERVLGSLPQHMMKRAETGKYFRHGRRELHWPEGAVSRESIRAVRKLPCLRNLITQYVDYCNGALIDLIQGLLKFDPAERLTAKEALRHPFFRNQR